MADIFTFILNKDIFRFSVHLWRHCLVYKRYTFALWVWHLPTRRRM